MSTLRTNTLQNAAGTASVPMDTVVSGTAKAWVNFNGVTTATIRASFNVSSVTRTATGRYDVTFTNALTDANYAVVACSMTSTPAPRWAGSATSANTTAVAKVQAVDSASANYDATDMHVAIFR